MRGANGGKRCCSEAVFDSARKGSVKNGGFAVVYKE
jgi:hypothetical protein